MVLANKLGIDDSAQLASVEEHLSKKRAMELFEQHLLDDKAPGAYATLEFIHFYLFQDIYDFAGQTRTVNIAKGSFRFAPVVYLNEALHNIEKMPQANFDEIIAKYVEMNVAHPFREGNGRAGRIWLDQMLKASLGQVVDWSKVDKDDYLLAMERSPVKDTELKAVLSPALTDKVSDREVYMKGIDNSYAIEGYSEYKASELL